MAIDFPNSPTTNQIFTVGTRSWKWDGTVWTINGNTPNIYVQDSPPSSPQANDQWFESDTGRWFIYYDGFWAEIGNATDIGQTPVGVINQYAGSSAPSGWLICDGTAISRSTYSSLFSVLSTTYGVGDGSTTFNVPDLRTRVPVGKSASGTFVTLGATGGVETVTLTSSESGVPAHSHPNTATFAGTSHNHTQDAHGHAYKSVSDLGNNNLQWHNTANTISGGDGSTGGGATAVVNATATNQAATAGGTVTMTNANNTAANAASAHTNLQPYVVVNYIIKV